MFGAEEKKEVYGVETLYRELGCYLKTKQQYAHSIIYTYSNKPIIL